MNDKFTYGQLLLVLNYDTHGTQCLTLTQRCVIHKVLSNRAELDDELSDHINHILVQIINADYEKKHCHYVEVVATGERVLIFDNEQSIN